jgi:hypothetical protein
MKATKAGQILGMAMDDYSGSGVGSVMTFVKTGYANGGNLKEIIESSTKEEFNERDFNLAALDHFMDQADTLEATTDVSEILTDRVAAGIEVITPRVTADTIVLQRIESVEDAIVMELGRDGQFVIKDTEGNDVIAFDDQGNAKFAGTVIADKIKANQIEGLEFSIRNEVLGIKELSSLFATSSAILASDNEKYQGDPGTASEPQDDNDSIPESTVPETTASSELVLEGLSVQAATVSGDVRVKGNGLIEGVLNVVDTLMTQNVIITGLATFFDEVSFKGNVEFAGTPVFNTDTGGTATIHKGKSQVRVTFAKEHESVPVVNASVTNGQYVKYTIADLNEKGFLISLEEPAFEEYTFSWISVIVKNPKRFNSE